MERLYGDERSEGGKLKATRKQRMDSPEQLRQRKQQVFDQMRQEYAQLKAQWGGNPEYDEWFTRPANNAQLNSVAAYYDLVPGFERLLALNGGDLEKFYEAADRLAKESKAERHRSLSASGSAATGFAFPGSAGSTPAAEAGGSGDKKDG